MMFGYFIWLTASFHWIDYQNRWLIIILLLAAAAAGAYFKREFFKTYYKKILIIEILTFLAYIAYLLLRTYNPAINGTERFMDMALFTAAGKTHYFPFIDPWYAGKTVNYYYYGSYLMSLISNISRIPYAISYTLALGLIYSQAALLSAALAFAVARSKIAAIVSAFLVTSAGNLFFATCAVNSYLVKAQEVCRFTVGSRLYAPSYIINEIPSYSFTIGDLHAHLLALPFFIFDLILLYLLAKKTKPDILLMFFLAFAVAISGMINIWDAITIGVLTELLVVLKTYQEYRKTNIMQNARKWIFAGISVAVFSLAFMWPNLKNYNSPVLGLGFSPAYVVGHNLNNVQFPTPFMAELGMWGIYIAGIALAGILWRKRQHDNYLFMLLLAIVSLGILVGVELFFVKDIYSVANPPYFRANTTFKFGFHAWTMLAIVFVIAIFALLFGTKRIENRFIRYFAIGLLSVAVIGGLFYPYEAMRQFYFINTANMGLDGSFWMKNAAPGDLDTINYINNHYDERKIIAEAVGDSFTTYSRITTYTGMITPMGWKMHEWTYRFDAKAAASVPVGQPVETGWGAVATVATDIQRLYETNDANEAIRIIRQYGIEYVYVGGLEYSAYRNLKPQKFSEIGTAVFQSGNSLLYKIN